ncbi:HET-domain-containing protein, partial [Hyaloscypha variabilis F]
MARKWLKDCVEGHENCSQPTGNIMPTRLLEVEHTQDQKHRRVRLCETYKLKVAPYAALSYCWGGTQPIMTTSENIKQHLTRIHYTELPATIQDAITITLSLGLRYIWIDSLCIIQNDNSDKLCEMGLMGSIYSQARVTISASRAVSVREGFLHDRAPLKSTMRSPILEYPYRCPNGEVTLVSLIHEAAIPDVQEKSWEPLSRRGWALQERLLSPRIIEYGSFQTRWICSHNDGIHSDGLQQGSQCVADHSKDPDTMFSRALALIQSGQNRPGGTQVTEPIAMPVYETWKDVVEHYTKRALTLSVDRLPAIAGVAMRFSRIVADEYCAGLWRSDLLAELLWRIEDPEEVVPRPQEYQGPSWSWAA